MKARVTDIHEVDLYHPAKGYTKHNYIGMVGDFRQDEPTPLLKELGVPKDGYVCGHFIPDDGEGAFNVYFVSVKVEEVNEEIPEVKVVFDDGKKRVVTAVKMFAEESMAVLEEEMNRFMEGEGIEVRNVRVEMKKIFYGIITYKREV